METHDPAVAVIVEDSQTVISSTSIMAATKEGLALAGSPHSLRMVLFREHSGNYSLILGTFGEQWSDLGNIQGTVVRCLPMAAGDQFPLLPSFCHRPPIFFPFPFPFPFPHGITRKYAATTHINRALSFSLSTGRVALN
jgi:hypothetical protein